MTTENLQPAETTRQPDHFAEIAAELYRLADDIASLVGSGLPKPSLFRISVQSGGRGDDELARTAVDAWATALFDRQGKVQSYPGGAYHYGVDAIDRGPIAAAVYMPVSAEWAVKNDVAAAEAELAEREAELEKARARVAELRGLSYSREPESTVVTPVPAGVDGHPEFSRGDRSVPLIGRVQAELLTGARLVDVPPVHLDAEGARTACRLAIIDLPAGEAWTNDHGAVTCKACINELPF